MHNVGVNEVTYYLFFRISRTKICLITTSNITTVTTKTTTTTIIITITTITNIWNVSET